MAILVTGGTGYIGSHTTVELLKQGERVIIVDNLVNSKMCVLDRVEKITGIRPVFIKCDLLDKEALNKVFCDYPDIDSVIHFAGLKAVGESVSVPLSYYYNNLTGSIILCQTMQKYNVKTIVFSSSATVYAIPKEVPIKETADVGNATNPYGETKVMIERILADLYNSDKEWNISILRYFNPIGAHQSGLIGEDPKGIPNNLLPYVAQVATGKLPYLRVFGNDYDTHDGTGVRDYIHVVDLSLAHLKALESIKERRGIDYFNIGTGTGYSVLDVVDAYEKASGIKINYQITDRRPGDISECYADPTKAKEILGWTAKYSLADMCRDSYNWQSKNPDGYTE